jgi:hypothetical protein
MARKAFCIVANDERGCAFLSPSYLPGRQCGAVFVQTTGGCFVLPGVRAKLTSSFRTPPHAGLGELALAVCYCVG